MTEAVTFDAPKFARHLTGAGMPAEQAEALAAELVTELVNQINSNVVTKDAQSDFATKADLEVLQAKIVAAIADARADAAERDARMMEKFAELTEKMADQTEKIAKLETQSERNSKNNIKWIVGTGVALAGVMFAMFQTMLPAA